jgi:hypothetical protein
MFPTVQGLQFGYVLHQLPAGRVPFVRWRWELWHGQHLVGAGWQLDRTGAARSLRARAGEFGARMLGQRPPSLEQRRHAARQAGDLRPGQTERLAIGAVTCTLVPRAADQDGRAIRAA